jgi:hypothetical protein
MNITAEDTARNEWEALMQPDQVKVKVNVSWASGICLPDDKAEDEEEAIFSTLTFGDNLVIEKAVSCEIKVEGKKYPVKAIDLHEFRRLVVKKNLLSWSLDIPIERQNGWMTTECYEKVGSVPAPLMEAFLDKYEASIQVTEAEQKLMERQSAVLFGKQGKGVADACEAVSLFCTLGNFAEKFGIDRFQLPELPMREYTLLKMMIGNEGDATRRNNPVGKPKSNTRIATGGGRIRPSRGINMGQ